MKQIVCKIFTPSFLLANSSTTPSEMKIDNSIFLHLFFLNFTVLYLQLAVDTNQTKILREIFKR